MTATTMYLRRDMQKLAREVHEQNAELRSMIAVLEKEIAALKDALTPKVKPPGLWGT